MYERFLGFLDRIDKLTAKKKGKSGIDDEEDDGEHRTNMDQKCKIQGRVGKDVEKSSSICR